MNNTKTLLATALSSLMLASAAGTTQAAAKQENEKCYAVVKAGKNDCQTAVSACAGTSTKDNQKDAWLYLPKGSCEKIVGGMLKAGK